MEPPWLSACHSYPPGVYPHVYGATLVMYLRLLWISGLSPCVWGHPGYLLHLQFAVGSIPMCMGPPNKYIKLCPKYWVYPHVYGATEAYKYYIAFFEGLSPCVWCHAL